MAKQFEIQLEFTTNGSADKLIGHLQRLAKEQNKISAAQRKFNNANLKAVTATKKLMMAEEKHRTAMSMKQRQMTILNRRIEKLTFANQKLGISTGRVTKAQNRMRISTSGLQRVIGSIRNKVLLVTFAFGGMAAGIRSSVQTAMQFEAVQVRLNSMFGSVRAGEKAFRTFNQVAATTPFTLTDVVEAGAALKAFGTNAEEMIKPTADLAAFMGTTATEAASALGRAFAGGAGAADILRERGILQLIRDTKGIDDLSKMTLPDFRKALEETLLDPSVGIAGATDKLSRTLTGMVSNMADAFTRMKAAIGDFVNMKGIVATLTGAFEKLGERIRQTNETPFETSIRHLQEMGVETTNLELTQAKLMRTRMEEAGVVKDLSVIEKQMEGFVNNKKIVLQEISKLQTDLFNQGTSEASLRKELAEMDEREAVANGEMKTTLKVQNLERRKEITNQLESIDNQRNILSTINQQIESGRMTQDQAVEYAALLAKILGLEEQSVDSKKKQNNEEQSLLDKLRERFSLTDKEKEAMIARVELFQDGFGKILSLQKQNLDQRVSNELKALRKTNKFRNASMEQRQTMEDDIRAKFAKEQQRIFEMQKKMSILKIIVDTITARNQLMVSGLAASIFDPTAKIRAKLTMAALMASSAAQIALVSKQQAPAFARGGSFVTGGEQFIKVGDNAGGRERVDITPLSSPDFGDAGGGTGVTVNIMGNVIGTQEFVRDSLLPEIENSIKRNLA
tara:strand:+ start:77 stop:2290 length:2214 start_codon:yes stop_codon:yes gene_type:complete